MNEKLKINKSTIARKALSLAGLEDEVGRGLGLIRRYLGLLSLAIDAKGEQSLIELESEIKAQTGHCFAYGCLGEFSGLPSDNALRELSIFALSVRNHAACFESEPLLQLETLLNIVFTRHKVDKVNGLHSQEFVTSTRFFDDCGVAHMSFYQLACLSGMTEMGVRNATRSTGRDRLETVKFDGTTVVDMEFAREWLPSRSGYVPTKVSLDESDKKILVPFARDGTYFPKGCHRAKGYQIGEKGDERYVIDKYEALESLKKMKKARWRRPNAKGIFGIVSVHEWRAIPTNEFERD